MASVESRASQSWYNFASVGQQKDIRMPGWKTATVQQDKLQRWFGNRLQLRCIYHLAQRVDSSCCCCRHQKHSCHLYVCEWTAEDVKILKLGTEVHSLCLPVRCRPGPASLKCKSPQKLLAWILVGYSWETAQLHEKTNTHNRCYRTQCVYASSRLFQCASNKLWLTSA